MVSSKYMGTFLLFGCLGLAGCGPKAGSTSMDFFKTINFIKENGLPSLSELFLGLPSQFSQIKGVSTSATGIPGLPSNLAGTKLSSGSLNFSPLLSEANVLSAQGFSEARRIEALLQNVLNPVFNMVDQGNLFVESTLGASPGAGMMLQNTGNSTVDHVIDLLTEELAFAVNLGNVEGMPSHLLFEASQSEDFISITGYWPEEGDALHAGFKTQLRLEALDDFDIKFFVSPKSASGLIGSWSETSCSDDLYSVSLSSGVSGKSVNISSIECPSDRNAVSTLGLAQTDVGMNINGVFSQTYADASSGSLRQWLGERQGFIMQATVAPELDKVAAAAAVLKSDDFANPSQESVENFGVSHLLSGFVQETWWQPTLKKAGSTSFDNIAYWTCKAPFVASEIKGASAEAKTLCAGNEASVDGLVDTLEDLKSELKGVSLASSVRKPIETLIDVLTIRNSIFIGSDAGLAYKTAPDETYTALNDKRKELGVHALDDLAWKSDVVTELVNTTVGDLPDSAFESVAGNLTGFFNSQCQALVSDATSKAKKSDSNTSVCSF